MPQVSFNHYDVGDLVRCSAAFTTDAGVAVDPTTVTAKVKEPGGTVTTYTHGTDSELVKSATGSYYIDVDVTDDGRWVYRFEGTGTNQAADEVAFIADLSEFT